MIAWRPSHERLTLEAANYASTTAVIRPGFVYGGTKSRIANYAESARATGAAVYIGDGQNRVPLRAQRRSRGALPVGDREVAQRIFHGVDGASPSLASVADAVSVAMGKSGETSSLPVEEARARLGLAADALCTDQLLVTKRSAELGWRAIHPTLDTDNGVEAAVAESKRAVGA